MSSLEKKKNISFSKIFALMGVALAVTVPVRIYQLFALTENDGSGFLKDYNFTIWILYAVLAVFSILILAFVTVSDKVTASKSPRGKNRPLAVGAIVMAVGIAYDVAIGFSTFIKSIMSYSSGTSIFSYLFSNGMFAVVLEAICGLAACIYFILYALSYFDGKTTYYEYKLLAIMPLFWAMFRLVHRFMTKISFVMVTDLMLEIFMLAFMLLFFMSFARISSQICQKGEMRKAMRYGVVAAMFALLVGVTRLSVTVCGKTDLLPASFTFSLADLAFGIFAVIYVNACSKTGRSAQEDDLLPDDFEEKTKEEETDDDFLEN